jgi:hypothetical protein
MFTAIPGAANVSASGGWIAEKIALMSERSGRFMRYETFGVRRLGMTANGTRMDNSLQPRADSILDLMSARMIETER